MRVQPVRKGPRRHIGLTPNIPQRGWVAAPFRPRLGSELETTAITGHVVVRPGIELTLAHRGIEEAAPRHSIPAGRVIDRCDDPFFCLYLLAPQSAEAQHSAKYSAYHVATIHKNDSI